MSGQVIPIWRNSIRELQEMLDRIRASCGPRPTSLPAFFKSADGLVGTDRVPYPPHQSYFRAVKRDIKPWFGTLSADVPPPSEARWMKREYRLVGWAPNWNGELAVQYEEIVP